MAFNTYNYLRNSGTNTGNVYGGGQFDTITKMTTSQAQAIVITDLLSEGPIYGLVDGAASVFLNDDRAIKQSAAGTRFAGVSNTTITLTNGSKTATINNPDPLRPVTKNEDGKCFLVIRNGFSTNTVEVKRGGAGRDTLLTTSSSYFTNDMLTIEQRFKTQFVPARLVQLGGSSDPTTPDGLPLEGHITSQRYGTQAGWNTGTYGAFSDYTPEYGNYKLELDKMIEVTNINGTTLTLAENWSNPSHANTTDEYAFDRLGHMAILDDDIEESTSYHDPFAHYGNTTVDFRSGTKIQPPLRLGYSLGSSAKTQQLNLAVEQSNIHNFGGSQSPHELNGTAHFGLSAAQLEEVDIVKIRIAYPVFKSVKGDGKDNANYVRYRFEIALSEDGTNYGSYRLLSNYVHEGLYKNAQTWEHTFDLDKFRPFQNFKIRVSRQDSHQNPGVRWKGGKVETAPSDWTNLSAATINGVTSITVDKLSYPYAAMASVRFSSKEFQQIPKRSYHVRGKMIRVPSNYVTREEAGSNQANYNRDPATGAITSTYQDWDGTFRDKLVYTNNPAWIFYDILTNNRYGLGDFLADNEIDKYSLYRIGRYCDELVPDGKGGTEPRYTLNTYLTKATDAYKVLKDLATNFLGLLYYLDGKVHTVIDAPSDPVYNFNKSNVIDGMFSYESTGSKTRMNQCLVVWNDPENNYSARTILVEDKRNIAETGKIISQQAVAFGCTSEGQATRYGRWKLWTAANQNEIVTFTTGMQGAYVTPGDVITIQDSDRTDTRYGGRISGNLTKNLGGTAGEFVPKNQITSNNVGGFTATQRNQPTFMEGEIQLPTSVTQDRVIFEYGGTTCGCWIGVRKVSNVDTLTFRAGKGSTGISASGVDGVYKEIPIADIPEFDGNQHTVSWHFHPTNGTGRLWIDGRLIVDEATTDGSAFTDGNWAGSDSGGWAQGFGGIAGNFANTEWTDYVASNLRVYANSTPFFPTTTTVPLDSSVTLQSGSTYTVGVAFMKPGAFALNDMVVNGVSYSAGDLIKQAFVDPDGNGTYTLQDIDTEDKAANAKGTANATTSLSLSWKKDMRTETKSVSTGAGSTDLLTVSSAFSESPSNEDIWILTETSNGQEVEGSGKQYRVVAVQQNESHSYEIAAAEHYNQKFDDVENDFITFVPSQQAQPVKSTDVVPPIRALTAASVDSNQGKGEDIYLNWSAPAGLTKSILNSDGEFEDMVIEDEYEHLSHYIIEHNIPNYQSPIISPSNTFVFKNCEESVYTIGVTVVNTIGNRSDQVITEVEVDNRFEEVVIRGQLGVPVGGSASTTTRITSGGFFEFKDTTYIVKGPFAKSLALTNTSTATGDYRLDCSNLPTLANWTGRHGQGSSEHHFVAFRSDQTSNYMKLLKYNERPSHGTSYWFDAGDGSETTGLTTLSGSVVTNTDASTAIYGSGTTFETDLAVGELFKNGTNSARVSAVISDTLVYVDKAITVSSSDSIQTNNYHFNYTSDFIIGRVYQDTSNNFYLTNFLTLDTGLVAQQGIERTLYAKVSNLGNAPSYTSGAGTFANPESGNTPTWSLAIPSMTADGDRIYSISRVFTSDGEAPQAANWSAPVVYSQRIDGEEGYTIDITRPAVTLPTTAAGVVTYTNSGTNIAVFKNGVELNSVAYNATPTTGQFAVTTHTGSNITPDPVTDQDITGNPVIVGDHSNMTNTFASVTYTINLENILTLTKVQSLAKSEQGDPGVGETGKRSVTGTLYYEKTTSGAPSAPTEKTYTFATGDIDGGSGANEVFSLADGTATDKWTNEPRTQNATSSNTFYLLPYQGTEATAGDSTLEVTYGTIREHTNFDGVVTFTGTGNELSDGTTTTTFIEGAEVNANVTSISGGVIQSGTAIIAGTGTNKAGLTGQNAAGTGSGSSNTDVRIFSGIDYNSRASAPFKVTQEGQMTASFGTIGGFEIGSDALFSTAANPRLTLSKRDSSNNVVSGQTVTLSARSDDEFLLYAGVTPTENQGVTQSDNPPFSVAPDGNVIMRSFELRDSSNVKIMDSDNGLGQTLISQVTSALGGGSSSATSESTATASTENFELSMNSTQSVVINFECYSTLPFVQGMEAIGGNTTAQNHTAVFNSIMPSITMAVERRTKTGGTYGSWSTVHTRTVTAVHEVSGGSAVTPTADQYVVRTEEYSGRTVGVEYRSFISAGGTAINSSGNLVTSFTETNLAAGTYQYRLSTTGLTVGSRTHTPVGTYILDFGYGYSPGAYSSGSGSPANAPVKTQNRVFTASGGLGKWNYNDVTNVISDSVTFDDTVLKTGSTMTGALEITDTTDVSYTFATSPSRTLSIGSVGAFHTDGGLSVEKSAVINGDLAVADGLQVGHINPGQITFKTGGGGLGSDFDLLYVASSPDKLDVQYNGISRFRFDGNGDFHADGNITAYSTTTGSDEKLKDNIEVIEGALETIQGIRGVTFEWKKDGKEAGGVIAQDIEKVFPRAVSQAETLDGEETFKTVDYNQIIGILVESVKELKAEIDELKRGK